MCLSLARYSLSLNSLISPGKRGALVGWPFSHFFSLPRATGPGGKVALPPGMQSDTMRILAQWASLQDGPIHRLVKPRRRGKTPTCSRCAQAVPWSPFQEEV